jgi:pimeloyl-ACP methyl ester carboxylesterase
VLSAFLGGSVFGETYGAEPFRVLALHGWRRTHDDFREALSGAATGSRPLDAVALDLPGFGASPPPPEAWGAAQYAQALAPLLEGFAEHVVVLGHSFGGRVGIELARVAPGRVVGLVLTGVPFVPSRREAARPAKRYRVIRGLAHFGLVGEARLESARKRYGSDDYRAASGVMRGVLVRVLSEDYTDALREIACPVALVWGANDTVAPPGLARDALEVLKDGRLIELPGVGHLVPTAAPAALYDAVVALRR